MSPKILPEDTSTSSKLKISNDLFDVEYNFPTALEVSTESSQEIDLTKSIRRNKELMEGIERAKRQISKGDLLTYDEVF